MSADSFPKGCEHPEGGSSQTHPAPGRKITDLKKKPGMQRDWIFVKLKSF